MKQNCGRACCGQVGRGRGHSGRGRSSRRLRGRGTKYRSRGTKQEGYGLKEFLRKTRLLSSAAAVATPFVSVLGTPLAGAALASAARLAGYGKRRHCRTM